MGTEKKKILIVYVDAGAGHKTYSGAIKRGIERLFPGKYEIREMDYIKELGPESVDRTHKKIWNFFLSHPRIAGFAYFMTEKLRLMAFALETRMSRELIKNSSRFMGEYKPDMIVAPHPSTLHFVVATNRINGTSIPVVGIDIEPFEGGSVYIQNEIDRMVVFSDEAKTRLLKKGVPEDVIQVFDFVVNQKFMREYDSKEVIRKRLGFNADKTIILMTSGGEGLGNLEKYIASTVGNDLPVQLVVLTGRNTELKSKLESMELQKGCKTELKIYGYMEDISDLLYVADIVFGKGGACTTVESLFMNKPIMFYRYVCGNEKQSVRFVKKNQLGWYLPTTGSYIKQLKKILENPAIIDDIKKRYREHDFKSGTDDLCRMIVSMIE